MYVASDLKPLQGSTTENAVVGRNEMNSVVAKTFHSAYASRRPQRGFKDVERGDGGRVAVALLHRPSRGRRGPASHKSLMGHG